MASVELDRAPALGAVYRQAAWGLVPVLQHRRRGDTLPDRELVVRDVGVDVDHLARYNRVCGFRLTDALPATYPHIVAFPLGMRLMAEPTFPFPLLGLVHVGNRITQHRPVDTGERLDYTVHAADIRPHERGRQFDVVAVVRSGGEEVWRGVSTYLHVQRKPHSEQRRDRPRPAPPAPSAVWRVPPRVGPDYAGVSGDHNPIHTSRIGARLLGFRRPIAHGMWSKARCLAALEGRLPEAYTVDVAFKLPVLLPATVAFSATPADPGAGSGAGGWTFALHDARTAKPHLAGTLTPPNPPA